MGPISAGTNTIGSVTIAAGSAAMGSVTANAGTNLNTSALALEATLGTLSAKILDYPTLGTPVVLAVSGTSARTAALTAGKYLIYTEATCGWRQGTGDPTAVLATDAQLPAGMWFPVTLAAQKLAAITAGGTGNLFIVPVS